VDSRVAVFQRIQRGTAEARQEWAFLSSKRPHTHDVRAMCVVQSRSGEAEPQLLTGGNDVVLMKHSVAKFLRVRMHVWVGMRMLVSTLLHQF
jgi:U3 small nucleolar RNA-associated protein 4